MISPQLIDALFELNYIKIKKYLPIHLTLEIQHDILLLACGTYSTCLIKYLVENCHLKYTPRLLKCIDNIKKVFDAESYEYFKLSQIQIIL